MSSRKKTVWRNFYSCSTSRLPGWIFLADLPCFMAVWGPGVFVGCHSTSSPELLPSFACLQTRCRQDRHVLFLLAQFSASRSHNLIFLPLREGAFFVSKEQNNQPLLPSFRKSKYVQNKYIKRIYFVYTVK